MNNFERFLDYIIKENIYLDKEKIFESKSQMKIIIESYIDKRNSNIYFEILFDKDDSFIEIIVNNIIMNFKSENDAISIINEFNKQYRGLTFYIEDNNINLKSGVFIYNNFEPLIITKIIYLIIQLEEYLNMQLN